MSKHKRAFLDFYGEHGISPVSQDISDLHAHFSRREALYRHLGIVPGFVRGKTILEFGPGSGHNALYTASLDPRRYVLVDGNPAGLSATQKMLESNKTEIVIIESLIETFVTDERFDIVICEGAIPWQKYPEEILKKIAQFVTPGGVLIITCIDEVSTFSESLRRLEAAIVIDQNSLITDQVKQLLPMFRDDLNSLSGMSRPHEDWILDQVLQPFIGKLFSIADAINTLDGTFDVYSASPHFLLDWTWYKEVPLRKESINQLGIMSFQKNIHNFLDYRFLFEPRSEEENQKIRSLIGEITEIELQFENTGKESCLIEIQHQLKELIIEVDKFSPKTARSLTDFSNGIAQYLKTKIFPPLSTFAPFFGRGQQYLSFIRK